MTLASIAIGIFAVVLGYLIGSFPSAYIVTKFLTGKDIRTIGTGHTGVGNVGARNVFVNVGKPAGVAVALLDIAKGAGAVALAELMMGRPPVTVENPASMFVLGAGLAAVVGHIWPVYLRFVGGAGLATSLGVLALLTTRELLMALTISLVLIVLTRNFLLSVNLSLIMVPLWGWMLKGWLGVVFPVAILLVMMGHFIPNIVAETKKAGSAGKLVAGLMRRENKHKKRA
jgi:glycerol-3-phosphate acyltransferase PlsY